jgi:hypothetical protein
LKNPVEVTGRLLKMPLRIHDLESMHQVAMAVELGHAVFNDRDVFAACSVSVNVF